jgi:hypothetical protein
LFPMRPRSESAALLMVLSRLVPYAGQRMAHSKLKEYPAADAHQMNSCGASH